jgi:hypothetical protein
LLLFQVGFGVRKYRLVVTQTRAWLEERGKVEQTERGQWDVPSLLYWRETAGLRYTAGSTAGDIVTGLICCGEVADSFGGITDLLTEHHDILDNKLLVPRSLGFSRQQSKNRASF